MTSHYSAAVAQAMRVGNMVAPSMMGGPGALYGELSETSKAEQLRHAALLKRVDAEKRARRIVVPTSDEEVRAALRKLGHPVRLFGESAADVRERLREILARIEIEGEERELVAALLSDAPQQPKPAEREHGEVYSAASGPLVEARRAIAEFSFARATARLKRQRERIDNENESEACELAATHLYGALRSLELSQSQYADERPLCRVRSSPTAGVVATGAWSGKCAIWDASSCEKLVSLDSGSDDRITGLAWRPDGTALAAGSANATCCIWHSLSPDDPTAQHLPSVRLEGHDDRLGNVAFHPAGRLIGTASFDHTWRLWDVETATELLLQDGHAEEVYAISFQPDGSLTFTGDFSGIGHLWDLRSGKLVHSFLGHSKKVLASDFAIDGYQLATASDDHTVRFWDLRRRQCHYVLPAHSSLIADCRFSPDSAEALATACFDGTVALWSTRDFTNLLNLKAHDGKTMSLDFAPPDMPFAHTTIRSPSEHVGLITAGYDRTFKIWSPVMIPSQQQRATDGSAASLAAREPMDTTLDEEGDVPKPI